jgi:hypothetical protein
MFSRSILVRDIERYDTMQRNYAMTSMHILSHIWAVSRSSLPEVSADAFKISYRIENFPSYIEDKVNSLRSRE